MYVCMYVSHQQDDLDIINLWDRLAEQADSFKTISDKNISIVFKTQNPGQVNLHSEYKYIGQLTFILFIHTHIQTHKIFVHTYK